MSARIVALSGGVGGAKLALGLSKVVPPDELLVVANSGDDFEHLGFFICPDTDTLLYTLGGVSNRETGWGLADETWHFMDTLREEHPDDAWFLLGDKDLETHRFRSTALANGDSLTEVTAKLAKKFGIDIEIVPMTDQPVRTHVLAGMPQGGERWLPFQDYFVRYRCEPVTRAIEFRGIESATIAPRLATALHTNAIDAIVICPSNPYLSVDPILAVPGLVECLRKNRAPVIAVSPVVGGRAIKGPTVKMMQELGLRSDVAAIARHYEGIVDGLVIDEQDRDQANRVEELGMRVLVTNTVMKSLEDRKQLARDVLVFAAGQ